jgi:hypothetical protein
MSEEVEIVIEPYRKVVIHEVVEQRLSDLIEAMASQTRAAGGTTIPMMNWCNGVIFQIVPFTSDSEAVIEEQLKGVIHYSSVVFATKELFEREVRVSNETVRLIDQSANSTFVRLGEVLKKRAKYHT